MRINTGIATGDTAAVDSCLTIPTTLIHARATRLQMLPAAFAPFAVVVTWNNGVAADGNILRAG